MGQQLVDEDDDEEEDEQEESLAQAYSSPEVDKQKMMEHFVESVVTGIILVKHGKQGDPHRRRIYIDDQVKNIWWKKENGKDAKNKASLPISEIKEIRWACDEDTKSADTAGEVLAGTPVLRNSCRWEDAPLAFSIIWEERSLDLQCHTRLECKYLIHCFRKLVEDTKKGEVTYKPKAETDVVSVSIQKE